MSSSGPNTTEEESSTYASQDDILKLEDFDEHEHENEQENEDEQKNEQENERDNEQENERETGEVDMIEDDIEDTIEDNEQESVPTLSHSPTPEESSSEAFAGFLSPDSDGYFTIDPLKNLDRQKKLSDFIRTNKKVTVIGLFGREKGYDSNKAIEIFDYLAQRDIFCMRNSDENSDQATIEGFQDVANNRIYLNLKTFGAKDAQYTQLLLFLFHVCQIIICFHPTYNFDQSYLRLFQTLEIARSKLVPILSKKLRSLKIIPKWWYPFGRSCNPRVVFYFGTCPLDLRGAKGLTEIIKKTGKLSKHPPIKRLEFSLEDQIHRIFKRARITHTANNLFNLSTKDNYVYVNNGNKESIGETIQDSIDYFLNEINSEQNDNDGEEDSFNPSHDFTPAFYHQSVKDAYSCNGSRSFGLFMSNHFDTMVQRGPDNVDGSKYTSELPTAEQWYTAATAVFDVIFTKLDEENSDDSIAGRVNQTLVNHVDIGARFSDARCAKALPMAFSAYKEGLQSHYLQEVHNAKLLQAMTVYSLNARGVASQKYAELLLEECTNYWMAGRQMCEELSLTGNHCINRKHLSKQSSELTAMAVMPHRSNLNFISACNCGKRQNSKEDPFNLCDANFTFYSEMEEECCHGLERTLVPFHDSGLDDEEKTLQSLANLMVSNDGLKKQASMVESIPYMLTKNVENGIPAFPSWALTHIGASTIYSHSSGVNQIGLISGTRNLHAWDVPLKKVTFKSLQMKFPNLAENAMKRANFHPTKRGLEMGITAKIFIGMEYECPRGHRFISGSLDKAIRTAKHEGGSGSKFVNNDVPLYLGCPCRGAAPRPLVAQLMRIHVVTPKAPVKILFTPVVVPCPDGPKFHPGWKTPPEMPVHAYWILRLPFIYCGQEGSHLPPQEVPNLSYARLLEGCIQIVEEDITDS